MAPEIAPPPLAPLPAVASETPVKEEIPVSPVPDYPKEEVKRKRGKHDYETLFIRESDVTARLGKTVYIRREYHDRILKIIQVIGENELSLFSYIDNIIAHHFDTFQEEIVQLYNRKNSGIF